MGMTRDRLKTTIYRYNKDSAHVVDYVGFSKVDFLGFL